MTTLVIARNTFSEAIRKKILNIFLLVAVALIALSVSFSQFSFREQLTVIKSLGLGLIAIVGMLIILVLGINLISVECERRTIYTILAKPVRRHEFLLGKFLGALGTLFINVGLMSLVFIAMVTWKNGWKPEFELFKGVMMLFFQLMLLGAVAMVFSVFTTPVVNFFLTSAVYIIGSLSEYTYGMMRSDNAIVSWFYKLVHYLTPQFGNFNVQNPLIHPEQHISNEWMYYSMNILYAVVYATVLLIIAVIAFDRRDM